MRARAGNARLAVAVAVAIVGAAFALEYAQAAFFDRVMHTGPRGLSIAFEDAPQLNTTLELEEQQKTHTLTKSEAARNAKEAYRDDRA